MEQAEKVDNLKKYEKEVREELHKLKLPFEEEPQPHERATMFTVEFELRPDYVEEQKEAKFT